MIRVKPVEQIAVTKFKSPVTKIREMLGRPPKYRNAAEKQKAYRARRKANA